MTNTSELITQTNKKYLISGFLLATVFHNITGYILKWIKLDL